MHADAKTPKDAATGHNNFMRGMMEYWPSIPHAIKKEFESDRRSAIYDAFSSIASREELPAGLRKTAKNSVHSSWIKKESDGQSNGRG